MVYLVTGSLVIGLIETVAHWFIDYGKSDGRFGYNTDQALHIGCKVLWFIILAFGAFK